MYLPYITTRDECEKIARAMLRNYMHYKDATTDLEIVNTIIKPLDEISVRGGERFTKGAACGKVRAVSEGNPGEMPSRPAFMTRRAVTDISAKGWTQKLETCVPPSKAAGGAPGTATAPDGTYSAYPASRS